MRSISEAEKFTAFIVAYRNLINDNALSAATIESAEMFDMPFESMQDAWLKIAKAMATKAMTELLNVSKQYTDDEIAKIMENEK